MLEAIEIIKNRINALSDVKSLSFDPKSSEIYSNNKKEELFIFNEFYQAKGFRKIHLEVAKLGNSFQILHCVFFPDPQFDIPIFGMDLVKINDIVSAAIYNQLFTMHGTTMIFLAIMPLSAAFFNYLIPSHRMC